MIRIPKSVLTLGGVVFAAGALTLAVPRAAHAVAATLVSVANTAASPVPTVATDNPALQPFAQLQTTGSSSFLTMNFSAPAGKTWAIETVSVACFNTNGSAGQAIDVRLDVTTGGNLVQFAFLAVQNGSNTEFVVNEPLRAYADPGTVVEIGSGSLLPPNFSCEGTVSGHLVNSPIS